jgi:hypothetical protein
MGTMVSVQQLPQSVQRNFKKRAPRMGLGVLMALQSVRKGSVYASC